MVWVCVPSHNTPLQLTLPHVVPWVLASSLYVHHLASAIQMFNSFVPPLASKLDDHLFKVLLDMSSIADKAHLLSVSSPHAGSWLSATPLEGLGLHLYPSQFQVTIKCWHGLGLSYGSCCPLYPEIALDPLGHHAVTCKRGGDVVSTTTNCVMSLWSPVSKLIWVSRWKWVTNLTNHSHTRLADLLFPNWVLGKPHVKKLWTSMYNSAYNCDFKNLIAPLNSLGTLEIYRVIKTAN